MMSSPDPTSASTQIEQAIAWAIRVRDPGFEDWDALTEWLTADLGNADIYDRAVRDDEKLADLMMGIPVRKMLIDDAPPPTRRRFLLMGGGLVAASAAIGLALWMPERVTQDTRTHIVTAPGEKREILLAGGDRIVLNGATRLTIDTARPRYAALEQGQALFDIIHNEADPFIVDAGGRRLVDAGTRFDVVSENGELRVAVSEGVVIYEPTRANVRLVPGQALSLRAADAAPHISRVEIDAVGAWRKDMLIYLDAPVARVAADLTRSLGVPVRWGSAARREERFTGTLAIDGAPGVVLPRVAPLLGMSARRDGADWVLTPRDR